MDQFGFGPNRLAIWTSVREPDRDMDQFGFGPIGRVLSNSLTDSSFLIIVILFKVIRITLTSYSCASVDFVENYFVEYGKK